MRDHMRIIAVANQKGGVGKTATASALAYLLAEQAPTLAIDCDPQGNLTQSLGLEGDKISPSMAHVIDGKVPLDQIIQQSDYLPNLHIAPANMDLAEVERSILGDELYALRLSDALEPVRHKYRYIVIDTPPDLNTLTSNALCSATDVIVPVEMGGFSLRGTVKLMNTVRRCVRLNPALHEPRFLATRTERNTLTDAIRQAMDTMYTDRVYQTTIRKNVKVGHAQNQMQPLFTFAPDCAAANDYRQFLEELLHA